MDHVETEFLEMQKHRPLVWFRYIDDVFFIWTHDKILSIFLEDLNKFHPNTKFSHEANQESIHFLDLNIRLSNGKFRKICMLNLQTGTSFSTIHSLIQITPSIL